MTAPAVLIAAAIEDACDVHQSLPLRPTRLTGRMAYVQPATEWKQRDEDNYCRVSVGLVAWLIAGTTDPTEAYVWLDEQTDALMALDRIALDDDEVTVGPIDEPVLLLDDGGGQFYGARIRFSRFTTGD